MSETYDQRKSNAIGSAFINICKEVDADSQTILITTLRMFLATLYAVTVPDENGKKFERMKAMIIPMVEACNADYPFDEQPELED